MIPDTDALMAHLLEYFDQQPPGIQAEVEQIAAKIGDTLRRQNVEPTTMALRAYFARVVAAGLTANVGPQQSRAAHGLGMELAGVCVLRRQLEEQ